MLSRKRSDRMALVRRRMAKEDVVAVFVCNDGEVIEIRSDNLDFDLPKEGDLYSKMIGVRKFSLLCS